jgi:hypothetical protein
MRTQSRMSVRRHAPLSSYLTMGREQEGISGGVLAIAPTLL